MNDIKNDKYLYKSKTMKRLAMLGVLYFFGFISLYFIFNDEQRPILLMGAGLFILIFIAQIPGWFLRYYYMLRLEGSTLFFEKYTKKVSEIDIKMLVSIEEKQHGRLKFNFDNNLSFILIYSKNIDKEKIINCLKIISDKKKNMFPTSNPIKVKFIFHKAEYY